MIEETPRADEDALWRADGERYGWKLGRPAPWPLRLPGIRWVRMVHARMKVDRFVSQFSAAGIGLGQPNQRDLWVIYAIGRGWV